MKRKSKLLMLVAILSALTLNSALANEGKCGMEQGLINVIGTGEVKVMPDVVKLNYRVVALKPTAQEARAEIENSVKAFSQEVEKLNLGDKAFVANDISVFVRYEYKDNKQVLLGYEASRNVSIKLKDFSKISQITDLALKSGINQIDGYNYSLSDEQKYQEEAAKKAMAHAQSQAKLVATGFHVKLGEPCNITLRGSNAAPYGVARTANFALAASAESSNSIYAPDALTISATVEASFAIDKD